MNDRQESLRSGPLLETAPTIPAKWPQTTKHIVMWNVRGENDVDRQASIALVRSSFESLVGTIPGLLHIEIGVDLSRIDYACDIVLVSEFADDTSLAAYATHPAHLAVRDRLAGVRTARHQVDYHSASWPPDRT